MNSLTKKFQIKFINLLNSNDIIVTKNNYVNLLDFKNNFLHYSKKYNPPILETIKITHKNGSKFISIYDAFILLKNRNNCPFMIPYHKELCLKISYTKEAETIYKIIQEIKTIPYIKYEWHHRILNYEVDLYISNQYDLSLIIECNENNHSNYKNYNPLDEAIREKTLLLTGSEIINYNPDEIDFNIKYYIEKIKRKINKNIEMNKYKENKLLDILIKKLEPINNDYIRYIYNSFDSNNTFTLKINSLVSNLLKINKNNIIKQITNYLVLDKDYEVFKNYQNLFSSNEEKSPILNPITVSELEVKPNINIIKTRSQKKKELEIIPITLSKNILSNIVNINPSLSPLSSSSIRLKKNKKNNKRKRVHTESNNQQEKDIYEKKHEDTGFYLKKIKESNLDIKLYKLNRVGFLKLLLKLNTKESLNLYYIYDYVYNIYCKEISNIKFKMYKDKEDRFLFQKLRDEKFSQKKIASESFNKLKNDIKEKDEKIDELKKTNNILQLSIKNLDMAFEKFKES